jgi:hypothetical protein
MMPCHGEAADDQPARPPGVEHVEAVRLVVRIELRGQRIDRGFGEAPANAAE